ncbi:MAG: dienelactone hydrolase family protein [Caldilineaceae bacterium]
MATQPEGYLALPSSGAGAAVLVLHPWWGLNETIRAFCRRLADVGFVAFAPDLYHGQVTASIDEAETLVKANFQRAEQSKAEIAAAARFLQEHGDQSNAGIAVIGFSMGAYYAVDLSTTAPALVRMCYFMGPVKGTMRQCTGKLSGSLCGK